MKTIHAVVTYGPDNLIKGINCITTDSFIAHVLALGWKEKHGTKEVVEEWELIESENDLRTYEKEAYRLGIAELKKYLPEITAALFSPEVTLTDTQIEMIIRGLQKIKSSR